MKSHIHEVAEKLREPYARARATLPRSIAFALAGASGSRFPWIIFVASAVVFCGCGRQAEPDVAVAPAVVAPLPPVQKADLNLSPEEEINIRVYAQANRSVVNITTRVVQNDDFFTSSSRQGSGSGSVLDKAGHVVTNFHVVEGAQQIVVNLFDGSAHPAKLVGADPNNDLAVLKIDAPADTLIPIGWGDSEKLLVGMRVFAIGNPFGLDRTLTLGVVSSLGRTMGTENKRTIRGIIQTDAAINPGNSGGPLLNRRGEMIGINTAIISRSGGSSGVGLAIPANTARRVVEELIQHGRVIRADLGIASVFAVNEGLLVSRLTPGGPAEKAGLKGPEVRLFKRGGLVYRALDRSSADLIVALDGKSIRTLDELLTEVERHRPGDQVTLRVRRDGQPRDIAVTLELATE
jgi:S1-C subfamily serine protease